MRALTFPGSCEFLLLFNKFADANEVSLMGSTTCCAAAFFMCFRCGMSRTVKCLSLFARTWTTAGGADTRGICPCGAAGAPAHEICIFEAACHRLLCAREPPWGPAEEDARLPWWHAPSQYFISPLKWERDTTRREPRDNIFAHTPHWLQALVQCHAQLKKGVKFCNNVSLDAPEGLLQAILWN